VLLIGLHRSNSSFYKTRELNLISLKDIFQHLHLAIIQFPIIGIQLITKASGMGEEALKMPILTKVVCER
jgi:hypothetical protein